MFKVGDIAVVVESAERTDGYLATRQGERVEVISQCSERKYAYCARRAEYEAENTYKTTKIVRGWVAADTLRFDCDNSEGNLQLAEVERESERIDGYLATRVSDIIEIRYIEASSLSDTTEWVFGLRLNAAVCKKEGWVAASTLRKEHSETLRKCMNAKVEAVREYSSLPGSGHLSTKIGDKLWVIYSDVEGWTFAERSSGDASNAEQGWIPTITLSYDCNGHYKNSEAIDKKSIFAYPPRPTRPTPWVKDLEQPRVELRYGEPSRLSPPPSPPPAQPCNVYSMPPPPPGPPPVRMFPTLPLTFTACSTKALRKSEETFDLKLKMVVQLLTFGLQNCDNYLVDRCSDGVDTGKATIFSDAELQAALTRLHWPEVDIFVDCRRFPDPHKGRYRKHIGVHPEIIHGICENRCFASFLRNNVKSEWKRVLEAKRSKANSDNDIHLVVAFYCNHGRHRSVAVCEIMRHLFQICDGFRVNLPIHLASVRGWRRKLCKGTCEECIKGNEKKDNAFAKAAYIWQKGGP